MIGWTSSAVAGVTTAVAASFQHGRMNFATFGYIILSVIGVLGINFVLLLATSNLERKQFETYGTTNKYHEWMQTSWSGFMLPSKKGKIS
jgi:hypothetical protein